MNVKRKEMPYVGIEPNTKGKMKLLSLHWTTSC